MAPLPFASAFEKVKEEDGKARYKTKGAASLDSALVSALPEKTVVKLAGKNGIPEMVDEFLKVLPNITQTVLGLVADPKQNMVLLFDGDNYEPSKTPFSILIKSLAPHVAAVLAVKKVAKNYSTGFVEGWCDVPNMSFFEVDEDQNDWVTRRSDHVLNIYSILSQYRLRPTGEETTGYRQLKQQMEDSHNVKTLTEGIVLCTMRPPPFPWMKVVITAGAVAALFFALRKK